MLIYSGLWQHTIADAAACQDNVYCVLICPSSRYTARQGSASESAVNSTCFFWYHACLRMWSHSCWHLFSNIASPIRFTSIARTASKFSTRLLTACLQMSLLAWLYMFAVPHGSTQAWEEQEQFLQTWEAPPFPPDPARNSHAVRPQWK